MKLLGKSVNPTGQSGNKKGVALVTVLAVMSLSTILILTFFSLAQSEHKSSSIYSNGLQAQQVGEQAVNMVIAQIRKASSGDVSWASQPGALRTWTKNGDFDAGYKLYSDDVMEERSSETELVEGDFDEMQDWSSRPEVYVDLNEPVIRGEKVYFPIVDPIARSIPEWPKKIGNDDRGIEGFDYHLEGSEAPNNQSIPLLGDNGDSNGGGMRDSVRAATSSASEPERDRASDSNFVLPMPVKWIYQLADGTLGTLGSDDSTFSPFGGGAAKPAEDNRIVARFAFWADDETSKLNINVHAGGLAWDTPKAGGDLDMNMGKFQPAQHEWQRYPGHPATTHLIPVLAPGVVDIVQDRDAMELIFDLVPRVVGGGSNSGTTKIDPADPTQRNGLVADLNPLYPSLDEFLFTPNRELSIFPDGQGGSMDPDKTPYLLERAKFFLTVNSRAPETTLFNTPRVAMWPIFNTERSNVPTSDYQTKLTHFDRLIHYCSTIGGLTGDNYDYIFRRENADSRTHDFERIQRNQELYGYLDALMGEDVPGYGSSFRATYGPQQQRQILTQIFDYIRSTNLHDDSLFGEDWKDALKADNFSNHLTYTNPRGDRRNATVIGEDLLHKGHGQVAPIQISHKGVSTKGFGRFYTLSEASIMVICCADAGSDDGTGPPVGGVARSPKYPGITQYGGGFFKPQDKGDMYSAIPPLSINVNLNYASLPKIPTTQREQARLEWPQWMRDLHGPTVDPMTGDPYTAKGLEIANSKPGGGGVFDKSSWNWQLMYLEPSYDFETDFGDYGALGNSDDRRLKADQKLVQAAMVFNMFTPSLGWVPINPDMMVDISMGLASGVHDDNAFKFTQPDGRPQVGFEEAGDPHQKARLGTQGGIGRWATNRRQSSWHDRHYGGTKPISYMISSSRNGRITPLDPGYSTAQIYDTYPWVTKPFVTGDTVEMTGGHITFEFHTGDPDFCQNSFGQSPDEKVQTIEIEFPPISVATPTLGGGRAGYRNEFGGIHQATVPMEMWSLSSHGINPEVATTGRMARVNSRNGGYLRSGDIVQSVGVQHGDVRLVAASEDIGPDDGVFGPHWLYNKAPMAHSMSYSTGRTYEGHKSESDRQLVPDINYRGRGPVTMIGDATTFRTGKVQRFGDFDNGPGLTVDGPYINKPDEGNTHSLFNKTDTTRTGSGQWAFRRDYGDFPYFVRDWVHEAGSPSYFSPNRIVNGPGMFGSLPTGSVDGDPWKTLLFRPDTDGTAGSGKESHPGAGSSTTVPDHLIMDLFWMPVVEPYAISEPLSTGGKVNLNYQMLPFKHIERSTALRGVFKSEYMLCVPTRGTSRNARSEYTADYKHNAGRGRNYHWRDAPFAGNLQGKQLRTVILEDQTLSQFDRKFREGFDGDPGPTLFKSASEITTVHLVPQQVSERQGSTSRRAQIDTYTPTVSDGGKVSDMESGKYWEEHAVVGDNSRERPYGNIYSRVTTKSNTFKVHYRAQVLKQSRRADDDYTLWDPTLDSVVGEYRGSTVVERYIDPTDTALPDYANEEPLAETSLGEFYKFRIVNPTRFSP